MRNRRLIVWTVLACMALGCAGGSGPGVDLRSLQIQPLSPRLTAVGDAVQFSVRVVQGSNSRTIAGTVTWTSSNATVVAIDGQGRAEAKANGTSVITARADGLSKTVTVQVAQEVAEVVFEDTAPIELSALGQGIQLLAEAWDSNGNPVAATAPTYASDDTDVATVTSNGIVEARANGSAKISATIAGVTGVIDVIVQQKTASITLALARGCVATGASMKVSAIPVDSRGNVIPEPNLIWETSAPEIGLVDGSGNVVGVSAGPVEITAREGEVFSNILLLVEDPASGIDEFPNRPCGMIPFADQSWDALGSEGWGHLNRDAESVIVDDPTAPFSPSGVLEHRFPGPDGWMGSDPGAPGFMGGGEPAVDWINLQDRGEVFLSLWWFANASWEGHPSNVNKILFLWDDDFESNFIFSMRGPAGGPYFLQALSSGNPDPRKNYFEQNRSVREMVPGRWYQIEIYIKMDTAGGGVVRWWQDGELLGEITNFSFRTVGLGDFHIAPTWGGINFFKSQDDLFRYDHIRFWGR